jgi:DNA-binding transcriptional regulator YiaG
MSPDEFKEARRKLGLSAQELATALGVADGRTVRRWEAGDRDIPGPAIVLLRIWCDARCPDWARPWITAE